MRQNSNRRNLILHRLPRSEFNAISADLKPVVLQKPTALFDAGEGAEYVYFPTSSVISIVGDTGEGGSIEVWVVGKEGAAGISAILGNTKPFRAVVQITGNALVGKASSVRRHFQKHSAFHDAILSYYNHLLVQISYLGICNNRHGIEQRFSRWLLMVQDRAGTSELKFTQDSIAGVLGTRRATISVAAAALQSAGLITYTPGAIKIKSRKGLLQTVCGCYKIISSRVE